MDQAALEAAEAQFLAAARAYVANLVKQKPGDPRFGRDDQPPGNR
jgi:hypothetical protein